MIKERVNACTACETQKARGTRDSDRERSNCSLVKERVAPAEGASGICVSCNNKRRWPRSNVETLKISKWR